MPRRSEKHHAPTGYMTPQAAGEILGISDQTIRKRIKAGTLEGTEVLTENKEPRYYVARAAVEVLLTESNGRPPDVTPQAASERYIEALEAHNETLVRILEELRDHAARTDKRLEVVERPWWRRL